MKKNRFSLILSLFLLTWSFSYSQISEGGTPPSFKYTSQTKSALAMKPVMVNADFDVVKQILLDNKEQEEGMVATPLKVGKMLPVNLNINKDGEWTKLPDGTSIWRLTIKSPDALAMMLYYDDFYIPKGGKLFIYNKDQSHVLGAYTNNTNPKMKIFATEFLIGDEITLEYATPTLAENVFLSKGDLPRISISDVVYGYNNIQLYGDESQLKTGQYNDPANSCMVNINCPEGDNWQTQKKGVAATLSPIISRPGYVGLCSGTLINNTSEDLTPYYLTAYHCFEDGTDNDLAKTVFYFHYELPGCEMLPVAPTGAKTMTGAQILASSPIAGGSDGQLLKLNEYVPADYDVYYNGWDRRNNLPPSGVGIHHPGADVKKISTFKTPAIHATWNSKEGTGAANAHMNVIFSETENGHSVTEGGSSGSPLFNPDGLVVGTLSGGNSSCSNLGGLNLYGKLWYHWDQYSDANQHFAQYLDPRGSGVETLQGTDRNNSVPEAIIIPDKSEIYVFQSVTYKNRSSKATTFEWTFEGGHIEKSSEENPPAIIYNKPGVFRTSLIINKGTADERQTEVTIKVVEKGDNPAKPVAAFSLGASTLEKEGFDVEFPPAGWKVDNNGGSANVWKQGNPSKTPFSEIDPESKASALVAYDENNEVDTWLKTASYTIEDSNYSVEFYAGYSGPWITGGMLSFYVSEDGTNYTELWTNGPDNQPDRSWQWTPVKVDLAAYAGKNVQFAWQYKGKDGDLAGIDGFQLKKSAEPGSPVYINVGDYIEPRDASTGFPILYEWTFDGGDPESFSGEFPKIRYMKAGSYSVKLWVKNYQGEDLITQENAVVVSDLAPELKFEAKGGFYTYPNRGNLIAAGDQIVFTNTSKNYPTSYSWTFDGGTPAKSTNATETVTYSSEGVYDLSVSVTNSKETVSETFADFVKVGEKAEIWNIQRGDDGDFLLKWASNGGYVTGKNTQDNITYAERFHNPNSTGVISSLKVKFLKLSDSDEKITISINKATSGLPGGVIESTELAVSDIPMSSDESDLNYVTIPFENPVPVEGEFFVLISATKVAEVAISTGEVDTGENTAYTLNDYWGMGWILEWYAFPDMIGMSLSMNVVPTYEFGNLSVQQDHFTVKDKETEANMVNVSSNMPWKVTAPRWITITEQSDASFSFKVRDNLSDYRSGYILVSAGGLAEKVLVEQSTAAPVGFTATYDGDATANLAWTNGYPEAPKVSFIQDSFESDEGHAAFAINSPGDLEWTYKDKDGSATFVFQGIPFENAGKPMAFIVFNPSELNQTATELAPQEGDQYLACFAAEAGKNNDWMISPKLSFDNEFEFSFWAKSFTADYGLERFNVYYAETADSEFIKANAGNYLEPSTAWTRYSYVIPKGMQYVAINCVSEDAFIFLVDNIFIGEGEPTNLSESVKSGFSAPGNSDAMKRIKSVSVRSEVTERKPLPDGMTIEDLRLKAKETFKGYGSLVTDQLFNAPLLYSVPIESNEMMEVRASRPITPVSEELEWHSGVEADAIGAGGAAFEFAVKFDASDLLPYTGLILEDVQVVIKDLAQLVLKVYINGEMKYTQPFVDVKASSTNVIKLSNPITIEAQMESLMISIEVLTGYTGFPAAVDNSSGQPDGKGHQVFLNGKWSNLPELIALNGNFMISGILKGMSKPVELSYNVYRDGEMVGSTEELKYSITDVPGGESCFEITAIQQGVTEIESSLSNKECIEAKYPLTIQAKNIEKYVGEENPIVTDEYTIKGFIDNDNITYLSKKPVATIDPIFKPHIGVGTYEGAVIVSGAEDASDKYRFIYRNGNLIVIDRPVGIDKVGGDKVAIYPTVTTGVININQLSKASDVFIFDFLGRMIVTNKLQAGDNTIDISSYAKGVYFVKVGNQVVKVIKQ